MAKISFRQGIVSHPDNTVAGTQTFLHKTGNDVDLVLDANSSSIPIIITFAHQTTDYLFTESQSVTSAWSDIPTSQDSWLYWELDLNTGLLERGITTLEPLYQQSQPSASQRIVGQMWFDTSNNLFRVWQGSIWLEVVKWSWKSIFYNRRFIFNRCSYWSFVENKQSVNYWYYRLSSRSLSISSI